MEEEEDGVPKTYWEVVEAYLRDKCTGHGFPRFRSGPTMGNAFRRTAWLFIALGFSGYCLWQLFDAVTDYYTYPSITTIEIQQLKNLAFPSVTICPLSAVQEHSVQDFMNLNDSLFFLKPKDREKLVQNMTREDEQMKIVSEVHEYLLNEYTSQIPVTVEQVVQQLGIDDKLNISHRLGYMIELQRLRRVSQDLEPVPVNGSVWTTDNAGRFLVWLNDTWNGNYFDIHQYMLSVYGNATNSSQMTDDYFSAILTRTMDNFRVSLHPGFQFPNPLVEIADYLEIKYLFSRKTSDPRQLSKETLARLILQRYQYPYMFRQFDIIQSCYFQDTKCKGQFYTSFHPKWRTCYHFNNEFLNILNEQDHAFQMGKNEHRNAPLRLHTAGKGTGLSLQLRMPANNESLLPMLDLYGGYLITVGDSATMPRWDMHVIIPKTGRSDIALKRTQITRLDERNGGDCVDDDYLKQVFPEYKIVGVYDRSICRQLLVFFSVLNRCNCLMSSDVMGGIVGIEDMATKFQSCSYETMPCTEYASRLGFKAAVDKCPPACHEVIVDVSVTSTPPTGERNLMSEAAWRWVEQPAGMEFYDEYQLNPEKMKNAEQASVNIFYDSPNVNVINEELIYTPYEFVANLGGIVGLYIGMSLVSVVEVMELILDLLIFHYRRSRKATIKVNVEEFGVKKGSDEKFQKQLSNPHITTITTGEYQQTISSPDLVSMFASIRKDVSDILQRKKEQKAEIMVLKNSQKKMKETISKILESIEHFEKEQKTFWKKVSKQ